MRRGAARPRGPARRARTNKPRLVLPSICLNKFTACVLNSSIVAIVHVLHAASGGGGGDATDGAFGGGGFTCAGALAGGGRPYSAAPTASVATRGAMAAHVFALSSASPRSRAARPLPPAPASELPTLAPPRSDRMRAHASSASNSTNHCILPPRRGGATPALAPRLSASRPPPAREPRSRRCIAAACARLSTAESCVATQAHVRALAGHTHKRPGAEGGDGATCQANAAGCHHHTALFRWPAAATAARSVTSSANGASAHSCAIASALSTFSGGG